MHFPIGQRPPDLHVVEIQLALSQGGNHRVNAVPLRHALPRHLSVRGRRPLSEEGICAVLQLRPTSLAFSNLVTEGMITPLSSREALPALPRSLVFLSFS